MAANELKERWSLKRRNNLGEIDLSEADGKNHTVSEAVEEILSEIQDDLAANTLKLARRKYQLVDSASRGKVAAREEYNEQRMTKLALELNIERYDKEVRELLNEIHLELQSLGLEIERNAND